MRKLNYELNNMKKSSFKILIWHLIHLHNLLPQIIDFTIDKIFISEASKQSQPA